MLHFLSRISFTIWVFLFRTSSGMIILGAEMSSLTDSWYWLAWREQHKVSNFTQYTQVKLTVFAIPSSPCH